MWPFPVVTELPWVLSVFVALTAVCAVLAVRRERVPLAARWAGPVGWPLVAALVGVAGYGEASALVVDVRAVGASSGYWATVPDLTPSGPLAFGLLLAGLLTVALLPSTGQGPAPRPWVLAVTAVVAGEAMTGAYWATHVEGPQYALLGAVVVLVLGGVAGHGLARWARGDEAVRSSGRWAVLLPAVVVMVGGLAGLDLWGAPAPGVSAVPAVLGWAAGLALLVVAAVAPVRWLRAAADLVALGLVASGAYAVVEGALNRSAVVLQRVGNPVGQGPAVQVGLGHNISVVGAIQGALLLALGVWLLPRTVLPDARRLLGQEPDPALAARVRELADTRAQAVSSAAAELRRIERDLHDGAQGRLIAIGMNLRVAEELIADRPDEAAALVVEAREASAAALSELRCLVRGIYPPVLADRGLGEAIRALALDLPLPCTTEIDLPERLDAPVESACYFAVAEVVTNAVRHADARSLRIRVARTDGLLRIEVTDDGVGGADPARGSGLAGVERRLASFDGILAVSSPPGGPTIVAMEVPCR
ncbi:signal transduction histidine kinase [Streptacidiphilus sp. BW17]|uniref:sensor histidine kinase n=1 Tax=Streptacidiphilus sp. BW17 TaxID=3156274 RepID=UPI00351185E2